MDGRFSAMYRNLTPQNTDAVEAGRLVELSEPSASDGAEIESLVRFCSA